MMRKQSAMYEWFRLFACAGLLFCHVAIAHAQTLNEVITRHITAIGGANKWRQLKTLKIFSEVVESPMHVELDEEIPVFFSVDLKQEITILHQNYMKEKWLGKIKILYIISIKMIATQAASADTGTGWGRISVKALNIKEDSLFSLSHCEYVVSMARADIRPLFLDYAQKGQFILKPGKQKVKGKYCYVIEGTLKNGTTVIAYIDTKHYYLVKKVLSIPCTEKTDPETGKKITQPTKTALVEEYKDFRSINGYVFPFKIHYTDDEDGMTLLKHTEFRINPSVDKKDFEKK